MHESQACQAAGCWSSLVQLLEQFCHPSNTGSWSGQLGSLIKQATRLMMKQLAKQDASEHVGATAIQPPQQAALLAGIVKLAERAHFSKDAGLQSDAIKALCSCAYLDAAAVLPIVVQRFQGALVAGTAMTGSITASIKTLAMCVRPLLLRGWSVEGEECGQMVAEAMMALTPGELPGDGGYV